MVKLKEFFDPHDWKIGITALVAAVALFAAVGSLFWLRNVNEERRADAIERDLFACQRGNVLRQQLLDIGEGAANVDVAQEELTRGLVSVLVGIEDSPTPEQVERINLFLTRLEVPFTNFESELEEFDRLVAEIRLVDCSIIVQVGPTTTTTIQGGGV